MQTNTFNNRKPPLAQRREILAARLPNARPTSRLYNAHMSSPLITPVELAAHLDDPRWVVVDCRFTLTDPAAGAAAYARSHIPGARYANLDEDLARRPGPNDGRHPLPAAEDFAARLGAWGVGNDSTVVAYDEAAGAMAARLWWLLGWLGHDRRLVLDGGFAAWTAAGLPTESRKPDWRPTRFVPRRVANDAVVDVAELPALQAAGGLLVDARAVPRYRGEQEPIDPVAGHVPGAVNRPASINVEADGRFRAPDVLRRELAELLGGRPAGELIAMCGSGVAACQLLLALDVAGLEAGKLYAGSWSEWIRDSNRPIATGPKP
jgi:thiosulfate/3-mercaptopyruvate sulfurtransferase